MPANDSDAQKTIFQIFLAGCFGIAAKLTAAALARWKSRKDREQDGEADDRKEDAARAKIQSEERLEILRMYRQEIVDLKATMTEMMARHRMEMESLREENAALSREVTELETRLDP